MSRRRSRATFSAQQENHQERQEAMIMKWKSLFVAVAALTALAISAGQPAKAQSGDDPGPAAYAETLKDKRVVLVPMAMGFDLAQGWAAYLKREVEGWGGVFETRDPNWSTEAAAQALTEAGIVRSEAERAGRALAGPQLVLEDPQAGAERRHLRRADRQSHELRRPTPSSAATGTGWASSRPKPRSRVAAKVLPRRSAWCRAMPPTPPASTSTTAS